MLERLRKLVTWLAHHQPEAMRNHCTAEGKAAPGTEQCTRLLLSSAERESQRSKLSAIELNQCDTNTHSGKQPSCAVLAMNNRVCMGQQSACRQSKKVAVPVVPDLTTEHSPLQSDMRCVFPAKESCFADGSLRANAGCLMRRTTCSAGCMACASTCPYEHNQAQLPPCHRNSTGSNSSRASSSGFESMKSGSSQGGSSGVVASASSSSSSLLAPGDSPLSRVSLHSASSIASTSDYRSPVSDMLIQGIPQAEVLALWLEGMGYTEYMELFVNQGYDLATIARITPEDLLALGITQPVHRKRLIADIHTWRVTDSWPVTVPSAHLREWLSLLQLSEYTALLESQGYSSINELLHLTWEDWEDVGVHKLGHLKRLGLAIKKMKDYQLTRVHSVQSTPQFTRTDIQEQNPPPPPAPGNTRCSAQYASWTRCKPTVQVYPHHHSMPRDQLDEYNSADSKVRLSLYSPTRILSEETFSTVPQTADSEDYPPPPAPLACEGSIRLLRSAFHDSVCTTSNEQLPFANDNCGTIRTRDTISTTPVDSAFSPKCYAVNGNGDVLNDIGYMLQNLTDELDAMLVPSQSNT